MLIKENSELSSKETDSTPSLKTGVEKEAAGLSVAGKEELDSPVQSAKPVAAQKEIERKFIVYEVPESLVVQSEKEIAQTYLAVGPEEVRVRRIVQDDTLSHTMTIKKGTGLSREEIEFDISEETYQQLLANGNPMPLIKKRQAILHGEYFFDLDHYPRTGLTVVEVEFNSEEDAAAFIKPDWFGREVTTDQRYKNQNLWKRNQ